MEDKEEKKAPTVLIADDDESLVQAMCRRMRNEGFNIIVAADGYQAVHLAEAHKPDVIVLDIQMPAGSGFLAHERIESQPDLAGTPVIYITGKDTSEVFYKIKDLGARALLLKPFDTTDLVKLIREAVET